MIVRGRIILKECSVPFEVSKTGKGLSLRIELPEKPLEYSVDCPCLEPLELLGLFLPALEEELGEVEGVFVEEVVGEGVGGKLTERLRKLFNPQER
ncbi:hypothetical protein [Thermococcus gorgonarius]|uniref:Uncharacterized protein n=1 Tax=Thermococcus gorgonarius TaxID=71997 RepID=A0A2Z2M7K2_THEGO|nr:hypothetical protein [Thermococcus gorgonarius]ASJ01686.1 hypothetical protein A3K92_02760 [Thermococcus gorgonarius]